MTTPLLVPSPLYLPASILLTGFSAEADWRHHTTRNLTRHIQMMFSPQVLQCKMVVLNLCPPPHAHALWPCSSMCSASQAHLVSPPHAIGFRSIAAHLVSPPRAIGFRSVAAHPFSHLAWCQSPPPPTPPGISAFQKLELLQSLLKLLGYDDLTVFGDCFDEVTLLDPVRFPGQGGGGGAGGLARTVSRPRSKSGYDDRISTQSVWPTRIFTGVASRGVVFVVGSAGTEWVIIVGSAGTE